MLQHFKRPDYRTFYSLKSSSRTAAKTSPNAGSSANTSLNTDPQTSIASNLSSINATRATNEHRAPNSLPIPSIHTSDIYNDSDNDISTLATSVNPSDSISQTVLTVSTPTLRLQVQLDLQSWVFDHFIAMQLDEYYKAKQT